MILGEGGVLSKGREIVCEIRMVNVEGVWVWGGRGGRNEVWKVGRGGNGIVVD